MKDTVNSEMPVASITPFGLRLQPDLKRRVEEAAKLNGRSLNAEIAARLEASLRHENPNAGEAQAPFPRTDLAGRIAELERAFASVITNIGDFSDRLDRAGL